jgi:hypothetical protein
VPSYSVDFPSRVVRATLIPINTIQKNPLAEKHGDKLLEISGWVDCTLDPGPMRVTGLVEVRLDVALSLKSLEVTAVVGTIASRSTDAMKLVEGRATVLEKRLPVSGAVGELALNLVLMISAHHVDISHMRLLADTARDQSTGFMLL